MNVKIPEVLLNALKRTSTSNRLRINAKNLQLHQTQHWISLLIQIQMNSVEFINWPKESVITDNSLFFELLTEFKVYCLDQSDRLKWQRILGAK